MNDRDPSNAWTLGGLARGRMSLRALPPVAALLLLAGAVGGAGCGTDGQYVRAEDLPRSMRAHEEYRVSPGDVLEVRVWNQASMSVERARVRDDGKITVPVLQDVEVAGRTPAELSERLQVQLKKYVVSPVVTVIVQEQRPLRVSVTGKVRSPGVYELDRDAGVLSALAAAGGFTDFAHPDRIFVLRRGSQSKDPAPTRIRFRYESLVRGDKSATSFQLQAGDVLVVE